MRLYFLPKYLKSRCTSNNMGTQGNRYSKSLLMSQAQLPRSKHATPPVLGDVCTGRTLLLCLLGEICRKQTLLIWMESGSPITHPYLPTSAHLFALPWASITMEGLLYLHLELRQMSYGRKKGKECHRLLRKCGHPDAGAHKKTQRLQLVIPSPFFLSVFQRVAVVERKVARRRVHLSRRCQLSSGYSIYNPTLRRQLNSP